MFNIQKAEFRRMSELEGRRCAEIEVTSGKPGEQNLLVYVAKSPQENDYEIVHMYQMDTDPELDWYNNNLHNAYEEIAEEEFGPGTAETFQNGKAWQELFKEKLLAYGNIAEKLSENL
ncbi:hypothetical protein [Paenibacillus caui]|uniref:hypothetical protein n=1 Tax=Paenibacillus caui TaxID=2873927 RepID=UPI001CA95EED|nr:hypothetical protein [Paenibacillus caui]